MLPQITWVPGNSGSKPAGLSCGIFAFAPIEAAKVNRPIKAKA
jgi:hypothetical protein